LIESIDVVCRPGKRVGRSLKKIRDVPIKAVAQELELPIHERDTFTGWQFPKESAKPINLIIAVSFGLFIPPRVLKASKYGGLNVHPSLLPNFRGPAPLQHTLISGEKYTGVTLQTLDEKTFDHGLILAQTPLPGLPIPNHSQCTYPELLDFVTPKAAEILIQGLRDRVFVPPLADIRPQGSEHDIKHAPKITPEDRHIDWRSWTSVTIGRRHRALGRLWCLIWAGTNVVKRFVFEDSEEVPMPEALEQCLQAISAQGEVHISSENDPVRWLAYVPSKGTLEWRPYVEDGNAIIIAAGDGAVRVQEVTVEGQSKKPASKALRNIEKIGHWEVRQGRLYWVEMVVDS